VILSAAQVASLADGIIIVDGDWPKICPQPDQTGCTGEHCDCPLRPPAEWVALVGKLCETCDGECGVPMLTDIGPDPERWERSVCPDCRGDGLARIELFGPCHCMSEPIRYSGGMGPDLDGSPDECPDCYQGEVSLGWWKVTAVLGVRDRIAFKAAAPNWPKLNAMPWQFAVMAEQEAIDRLLVYRARVREHCERNWSAPFTLTSDEFAEVLQLVGITAEAAERRHGRDEYVPMPRPGEPVSTYPVLFGCPVVVTERSE
jgi:hypothetical protein